MDGAKAAGGVDRSKWSSSPNVSSRIQKRQRNKKARREVRLTKHTDHINTFRRGVTAVPMALQSDGEDFDEETSLRETPHVKSRDAAVPSSLLRWSALSLSMAPATPSSSRTGEQRLRRLRRRHGRGQAALSWPTVRAQRTTIPGARGCRRPACGFGARTHAAADDVRHRGSAACLERRLQTRASRGLGSPREVRKNRTAVAFGEERGEEKKSGRPMSKRRGEGGPAPSSS